MEKITHEIHDKADEIKLSQEDVLNQKITEKTEGEKVKSQEIYYQNHGQERKSKPKTGSMYNNLTSSRLIASMKILSPTEKISLSTVIETDGQDILACRFDHDGSHIALALVNGEAVIYSSYTGKLIRNIVCSSTPQTPVTSLRWKPRLAGVYSKNILVTGSADGKISHWHASSGKLLDQFTEEDNQILALDFNLDGSLLASGGANHKVQLYDEEKMIALTTLERSLYDEPGHSNRVFSVKFVTDEPNLLLSGGWDNNVHIWDIREGKSIFCMYGHMISGDAIDYKNGVILTGHCSAKDQLDLWDLSTRKLLRHIQWEYGFDSEKMNVYSAQFSKKSDKYILACGSGYNEARVFSKEADYMDFAKVTGFSKGLFSVDFASLDDSFAIAGADGEAHIIKIVL